MEWDQLYNIAKEKLNPRTISPFIEAGSVASAILTSNGSVYTGVCIDTACTLGMCAESAHGLQNRMFISTELLSI